MQRGFATLEIILATFIIALLMSVALPNTVRIVDRVALDYEYKRLYSDLRFLQALGRSGTFDTVGTGRTNFNSDDTPYMQITPAKFGTQILRGDNPLREAHYMQHIKRIELTGNVSNKITFGTTGQPTNSSGSVLNGTLTLTSRLGTKKTIVFDSVGRIRGGRVDE